MWNCRVAEQAEVNNMPASNLAIGELPCIEFATNPCPSTLVFVWRLFFHQCLVRLYWKRPRALPPFPPLLTLSTRPGSSNYSPGIKIVKMSHNSFFSDRFDLCIGARIWLIFRHATSVFGPPPIPGEGPGGRGSRQRPSDRHSGSDAVPADIRIGNDSAVTYWMWIKGSIRIEIKFQGSISDDEVDGDNEPLPDFLLPEYSQKDKVLIIYW